MPLLAGDALQACAPLLLPPVEPLDELGGLFRQGGVALGAGAALARGLGLFRRQSGRAFPGLLVLSRRSLIRLALLVTKRGNLADACLATDIAGHRISDADASAAGGVDEECLILPLELILAVPLLQNRSLDLSQLLFQLGDALLQRGSGMPRIASRERIAGERARTSCSFSRLSQCAQRNMVGGYSREDARARDCLDSSRHSVCNALPAVCSRGKTQNLNSEFLGADGVLEDFKKILTLVSAANACLLIPHVAAETEPDC